MKKFKFLILTLLLSSFSATLFASSLQDSTGVENQNGKKIILHKVEPKENFYSIGRKYSVSPKAIMAYNNNITVLSIGQVIKVPTDLSFAQQIATKPQAAKPVTVSPVATQAQNKKPVVAPQATSETTASTTQYKVSAGETLYAIARRFNTKVDDIISLNNLKSNNLTPGQILLVRSTPPPAEKPVEKPAEKFVEKPMEAEPVHPAKRDSTSVAAPADSSESVARRSNRFGLYEKNERGVAIWTDNTNDLDPNKKLVLHRTAPVGTVIKITNPMTNRTTFAKVVGRFTENENTKDAIMVMTKGVAESLGAIDKRFRVIISYGSPNE